MVKKITVTMFILVVLAGAIVCFFSNSIDRNEQILNQLFLENKYGGSQGYYQNGNYTSPDFTIIIGNKAKLVTKYGNNTVKYIEYCAYSVDDNIWYSQSFYPEYKECEVDENTKKVKEQYFSFLESENITQEEFIESMLYLKDVREFDYLNRFDH